MSKLQHFGCMCSFHVPKLMCGISADLRPTSKAGIFVGCSPTSHKYVIFVISTGSTIEGSRVYFNADVFPDDLGGAIVPTSGTTTHNVAISACPHVNKSPMITKPAKSKITISERPFHKTTPSDDHDTQPRGAPTKDKRPCVSDNDSITESHDTKSLSVADRNDGTTTGTAAMSTSPKRKVLTFPKCPHRD